MVYETLLEKLLDDDNTDIIELQPDGGEILKFEQIGVVLHEGGIYAIMHPLELKEDQVVVFKVDQDDEEGMDLVEDENICKKILEIYENEEE